MAEENSATSWAKVIVGPLISGAVLLCGFVFAIWQIIPSYTTPLETRINELRSQNGALTAADGSVREELAGINKTLEWIRSDMQKVEAEQAEFRRIIATAILKPQSADPGVTPTQYYQLLDEKWGGSQNYVDAIKAFLLDGSGEQNLPPGDSPELVPEKFLEPENPFSQRNGNLPSPDMPQNMDMPRQ